MDDLVKENTALRNRVIQLENEVKNLKEYLNRSHEVISQIQNIPFMNDKAKRDLVGYARHYLRLKP